MRLSALSLAAALAATTAPLPAPLAAQPASPAGAGGSSAAAATAKLRLVDYLDWEDVQDPQLSPDGKLVVYTRRWVDKLNDRWESSLWIMNADGTRNRFLVHGSSPKWSPDGQRMAYTARGEPAGTQVWVKYMDATGAETQITRVDQTPSDLEWSPDGKAIAFRMLQLVRDDWRIEMPGAPRGAKWVEAPRVVTRMNYRRDRQGFIDDGYRQLFVVSADGGTPRQVTRGNFEHGAARWTPDGKSLLFSGLRVEDAEYQWRESEIYAADVAACPAGAPAGCGVRQLTRRPGPDGNPVPSPDGKLIAYTGYDATDDTWTDSKLYVMNADGSGTRVLSGTLDRTPQGLMWAADGSGVYFNAESEGARNLYFAPVTGAGPRAVTRGARVQTVTDVGRGVAVGVMSLPTRPNDVVLLDLRNPDHKWLTAVNEDVMTGKEVAATEELWYPSRDGMRIQGWIMKPPGFDPAKKYPLMLVIHGGPHSMYNPAFNFAFQDHAANGYVVLWTNPRGSTGYGSAFGNAIKNAYPGKDYDDLMAGVDTVIGRGYVDSKNLFVYGCSGGGVLTSWIVGHTDRFAAASANCPVTNWLSFVGTTDGSSWYRNFAKMPWEDPTEHLKRSPLMYVGNVKTPTMLMTGVLDLRTPIAQTEEYYQALKVRRVPTAMIRFNEEWHGTSSRPSNFLRSQLYLRSWFTKHANKEDVALQ